MTNFKNFLVVLFVFMLALTPRYSLCQRNMEPEIQEKIDDYVNNVFLPAAKISGLGLAVVQNDGEILYTTGYGQSNREKGIDNDNSTQSMIASVSKSFTALLVVKVLHEKFPDLGEAVLDTPIRKLMPEVNFTLPDRFRSEHANFRDLLAHRLCLFRGDVIYDAGAAKSMEEVLYRARYSEEICGIRSEFQYSNDMYVVAGALAGILANKSYADAMQDLLNDLGMTNSTVLRLSDNFDELPNRAMPYYVKDGEMYPMNTDLIKREHIAQPAGAVFVTPDDMARYMRFHLNLGSLDGRQVVPRAVVEWLHKPANLQTEYAFKKSDSDKVYSQFGYALGLALSSYDGWEMIEHTGYYSAYRAFMSLYPGLNIGIFSSSHMGPRQETADALHAFIFELLKGNPNPRENSAKLSKQVSTEAGVKQLKAKLKFQEFYQKQMEKGLLAQDKIDIAGEYGSGQLGEINVYEKLNEESNKIEYFLEYGKWYQGWLQEEAPNTLYRINLTTDVIQDYYAGGNLDDHYYVGLDNGTLTLFQSDGEPDSEYVFGTYKLGVRLDLLPPIPWEPDSCGV